MSGTMSEPTCTLGLALYQQNYESNIHKTTANISRTTYKSTVSNQNFLVANREKRSYKTRYIKKIIYGNSKIPEVEVLQENFK